MKRLFLHQIVPALAFVLAAIPLRAAELPVGREEDTPKEAVPPGYRVVEGDILVPLSRPKGTYLIQFWPSGVVPYEFDANVSAANRTIAVNAMAQWEAVANVDWRPRNGETDYVHIQDSTANNSSVGKIGGEQIINFVSWGTPFRLVHEMGHSLGFFHEQSRQDRDTYVTIVLTNVIDGKEHNFDKETDSHHYGPYDFDSVMHYAQCDFTICDSCSDACRTILVKAPYDVQWQDNIGQRTHLSKMDALTMSFLYPQGNWRFADVNYTGSEETGTFFFPAKTFANGKSFTPAGGTLWIQPGAYTAAGTHNKAMTLRAPLGGVTLR